MYSNNILKFQDSTTILNAHTKNVWQLIVFTSYVLYIITNGVYHSYGTSNLQNDFKKHVWINYCLGLFIRNFIVLFSYVYSIRQKKKKSKWKKTLFIIGTDFDEISVPYTHIIYGKYLIES